MSMDYSGTPGEYIYSHNATGKSASGIIANGSTSERDLGAQRSAGGADRQAGDQGGHLIADRFGGRNDPTNLDAQAANVNQKDQANVERNVANLAANPNNTVCAEEATVICFAEEYKEHNVMVLRPIDLDETCVLIVEKSADTDLWHDVEDDTVRSEILQKYMENNRPDCMEVVE